MFSFLSICFYRRVKHIFCEKSSICSKIDLKKSTMIDTFLDKTDCLEVAFFLNFSRLLRDVGLLKNDGQITIFSIKNFTIPLHSIFHEIVHINVHTVQSPI
jgi:hypothetical protein